jgi:anthranilate phosphoribosyltransferase
MSELLRAQLEGFRSGRDLAASETVSLFDALITSTDEKLLAELLVAWEDKGVTEDELFNLAKLMRSRMKRLRHRHPAVVMWLERRKPCENFQRFDGRGLRRRRRWCACRKAR